jgi:hypothetical protein
VGLSDGILVISKDNGSDDSKDGVYQTAQEKVSRMEYSKMLELGLELGVGTALPSET